MRVIVNTSPLISLDRISRLDALRELYGKVVRPQSVLDEIQAGVGRYSVSPDVLASGWILTEPDPPEMVLRRELGAGETAAIALALRSEADLIILDDLQARLVAQDVGLRITGTLGVLCAAHRAGILSDLEGAILSLQEAGFRVSPGLLERLQCLAT